MSRLLLIGCLAAALLVAPVAASDPPPTPATPSATDEFVLLLGDAYPMEAVASYHAALLHWLDSLTSLSGAGMTAGKTVEAHREEYGKLFGPPTEVDRRMLTRYVDARRAASRKSSDNPQAMTLAFFEADSLEAALEATAPLLDEEQLEELRLALVYFARKYDEVWRDGAVPNTFLARVAADRRRAKLSRFLVDVASFFGVKPDGDPRPRLLIMPVIDGFGTHAQAIGRHLLIEVRPWEGLAEEIPPIVHENAHFLYYRIDPAKRDAMAELMARAAPSGDRAWRALREALPTAIAQGVAGQKFLSDRWSTEMAWYHLGGVDRYAKALFPLVKKTLAEGGKLDEPFLREAAALFPKK